MKSEQQPDLQLIAQESQEFPMQFDTLLLATCSKEGLPNASYAPYLYNNGNYYIYISELSKHTQNLQSHPHGSILFIENEQEASHLFARKRLTLSCQTEEISRENEDFQQIMNLFHDKFGKFIKVIQNLKDFHLYKLQVKQGSYVSGFAKAYELTGDTLTPIRHINEKGHQPIDEKSMLNLEESNYR